VWYVRVSYALDAPDDMQSKCRQLLYNTTLTFLVQQPARKAELTHH